MSIKPFKSFVYAFTKEQKEYLESKGCFLIMEDESNSLYIFQNTAEMVFDDRADLFFSDRLTL